MEETERKDNKSLPKVLIAVGALALLVLVILFFIDFGSDTDETPIAQEPVRTSKKDTIVVRRIVTVRKGEANEKIYTTEQFVDNTQKNKTTEPTRAENKKPESSPPAEDDFDKEYARSMQQHTIADVPARPRPQREEGAVKAEPTTDLDEVLIASELAVLMKEEKSLWQGLKDKVASFFGFGDEPTVSEEKVESSDVKEMLTELNAEIGEMQSRFVSYLEDNDITYIDHINRPSVKGTKGFYIYIGVAPNGFTFHRTVIRYSGGEKLNLQKILLQTAASDAIIVDASEIAQVNDTDEWVDLAPTQDNNELLNAVTSSDNIKITFMGSNGNAEWKLTEMEVNTLRESLHFYNLLKKREELLLN